jgi:acetyl esterase/lipase
VRALVLAAVVLLSGCSCWERAPGSYDPTNVPYGVFDVYRPRTLGPAKPLPALVYIHGGAWQGGDKADAHYLADKLVCDPGLVLIAVNYRVSKEQLGPDGKPVPGHPWPAMLDDVKTALRYVRDHAAELGVDPARIGTIGISAGAHLATMAHLTPGQVRPKLAVDLDGEADLTLPPDKVMTDFEGIMSAVLGHPAPFAHAELAAMSPVTYARADACVFVLHGERDDNIFVAQGDAMNAALSAAGADVTYLRLPGKRGECHGKCLDDDAALADLRAWLRRKL